jgi:hypothetical protein
MHPSDLGQAMKVTRLTKGKALTQRCGLCPAHVTAPLLLVNIYSPPSKFKVLLHCSSLVSMRICRCKASAPCRPITQLQAPVEPNPTPMQLYALEVSWRQPFLGCEKCVMTACVALPLLVRARGNCLTKKIKEVQGKHNVLFLEYRAVYLLSVPWESSVGFCSSTDESAG